MTTQEPLIQVKLNADKASGINPNEDQRLREASWQLNTLEVLVPDEYREAKLKFIGGQWIESVL